MTAKAKAARIVLLEDMLLFECPFCGMTLIKTSYLKVRKLLEDTGDPRGKICEKCGGTVVLKINEEARKKIEAKLDEAEW